MGRDLTKILTAIPLIYFLLLPAPSTSLPAIHKYGECLMACYTCVKTYGKYIYNGKRCATNCANTSGNSIDDKCFPPAKRSGSPLGLDSKCERVCKNNCPVESGDTDYVCTLSCILYEAKFFKCSA